MRNVLGLRIDDIGASTKHYEIYSKKLFGLGNILLLKYLPYFKAWGKYDEMSKDLWLDVYELLEKYDAKLTVGVTASWVHKTGELISVFEKFPEEVDALKEGVSKGIIEIANHGLTHCVLKDRLFLPKAFSSNRKYHREFWDWLPRDMHFEHIERSQKILTDAFGIKPNLFIPPGNVYCNHTLDACLENEIKYVNCNTSSFEYNGLKVISNNNIFAFHDKEIVEQGVAFLEDYLKEPNGIKYKFVSELFHEVD